jgi:type VI secretion system protein VasD
VIAWQNRPAASGHSFTRRSIAGLLAAAMLAGCSAFDGPPDPTRVAVQIEAAGDINPNTKGEPAPLVVRLYFLQSKDGFEGGEFNALYLKDKQTLAADLVSRQEFELRPGETKTYELADAKLATTIGVLAAYRDVGNTRWRSTFDLVPHDQNKLIVHLELGSVSVDKQPESGWLSFL